MKTGIEKINSIIILIISAIMGLGRHLTEVTLGAVTSVFSIGSYGNLTFGDRAEFLEKFGERMGEEFKLKDEFKGKTPGLPADDGGASAREINQGGSKGNADLKNLHQPPDKPGTKTEDKPEDKPEDKSGAGDPKADGDETVIKIGNKEYGEEAFAKLIEDANKHYGYDITTLPEEMMYKVIEDRVNLDAGSKSLNERNQQLAREREQFKADKAALETQNTELADRLKEIDTREKEINEKIAQNKLLMNQDPDDEVNDTDRLRLINKQENAERENVELAQEIKDLAKDKQAIDGQFIVNYTLGLIDELQTSAPELLTEMHVMDVMQGYFGSKTAEERAAKGLTNEDVVKSGIITQIINEYGALRQTGNTMPIKDFYEFNKYKYAALLPAQTEKKGGETATKTEKDTKKEEPKKKVQEFKAENAKQIYKNLVLKQKTNPATSAGSGANSTASNGAANVTKEKIANGIKKRFQGG